MQGRAAPDRFSWKIVSLHPSGDKGPKIPEKQKPIRKVQDI